MTDGRLTLGNAAAMDDLADQSVRLIVTSPPYFPADLEERLVQPRRDQVDFEVVERDVLGYALSLRPAFSEMFRIVKAGGVLILQTKDLRYGSWLIPLADAHAQLALQAGFHFMGRVAWAPRPVSHRRLPAYCRRPRVGSFRPIDVEWFLIFGHTHPPVPGADLRPGDPWAALADPLWRGTPNRRRRRHPYGSPPDAVARWIELFSEPGDLVVDPFVGYGTTVIEALRLKRHGVGYDVDREALSIAREGVS